MKKKKTFRSFDDENLHRSPKKMLKKDPRNLKRVIFDEIEEDEEIEDMFRQYQSGDLFGEDSEDE